MADKPGSSGHRLRLSIRRGAEVLLLAVAFFVGLGATAAWAGYDQVGRDSINSAVYGYQLDVTPGAFYPAPYSCTLYAGTVSEFSGTTNIRQVETGDVSCANGQTLDSSTSMCPSGHVYVEIYNGSIYTCVVGGTIADGHTNYMAAQRSGSTMFGTADGTGDSVGGFNNTDVTKTYAIGEVTGGSTCGPHVALGHFTNWSRMNSAGAWSYVNLASAYHAPSSGGFGPCWTYPPGSQNSTGDFDVH